LPDGGTASTLYRAASAVPSIQVFTDYIVGGALHAEFMKRCLPLRRPLRFLLRAMPGYEESATARCCWAAGVPSRDPDGAITIVTRRWAVGPRHVCHRRGRPTASWSRTTSSISTSTCTHHSRLFLLRGWADGGEPLFKTDPLGNPIDKRRPWNQTTIPKPQERNFADNYSWVMSPLARQTHRRSSRPRHRRSARPPPLVDATLSGLVDIGYVKAPGVSQSKSGCPKTATKPDTEFTWRIPKLVPQSRLRRARAPISKPTPPPAPITFVEKALARELHAGQFRDLPPFSAGRSHRLRFSERCEVLSHHLVIPQRQGSLELPSPIRKRHGTPTRAATPTARQDPTRTQSGCGIFRKRIVPDSFKKGGIGEHHAHRCAVLIYLPCGDTHMLISAAANCSKAAPTALMGLAR